MCVHQTYNLRGFFKFAHLIHNAVTVSPEDLILQMRLCTLPEPRRAETALEWGLASWPPGQRSSSVPLCFKLLKSTFKIHM